MSDFKMDRVLEPGDLSLRLSILATTEQERELDHAFWAESHWLWMALHDGFASLADEAQSRNIGWQMDSGTRCDYPSDRYLIRVIDNERDAPPTEFEFLAITPAGALAAGILLICQERLKREGEQLAPSGRVVQFPAPDQLSEVEELDDEDLRQMAEDRSLSPAQIAARMSDLVVAPNGLDLDRSWIAEARARTGCTLRAAKIAHDYVLHQRQNIQPVEPDHG